jgi:hypothetical protein
VANSNKRNTTVESLVIKGFVPSNSLEISEHILQFYIHLYSEQFNWCPKLDGLSFNSTDTNEALWMERDFEESEVFEVVKALNGDKALSLMVFISFGFLSVLFGDS